MYPTKHIFSQCYRLTSDLGPGLSLGLWLALTSALCAQTSRHELVAMRDGTHLATTVFLPKGKGPWPSVLSRTPYGQAAMVLFSAPYNAAGFAFIAQDVRGKGKSEGEYIAFKTDHLDGYDSVEWVARQPWANGRVGMMGASALGITANLAATQVPPHLECAYVVVAPASARRNTVYTGGVYRKEMNDAWLKSQGIPEVSAMQAKHPPGEDYWNWREIRAFHSRIKIPVYNVGGWYDIFSQGAIDNFVGLQSHGAGLAAGNQRLVLGPWAHGSLDGRLKYPDSPVGHYLGPKEQLRWFSRWLKDEKNGIASEAPVRYYVMGDSEDDDSPGNEWKLAPAWPPPSRPLSLYLNSEQRLTRELPRIGGKFEYTYDPAHPVPTIGGANLVLGGKGPDDQRSIPERPDYLRLESEILKRPLEIAGQVYADFYVSSDCPDTDFSAKLVDVYPDGYEALVSDGILRMRYRDGLTKERFLKKGEIVQVRIDLWSTAIVFNTGHRIALHVSSSNDPKFDPNPNTGRPLRADKETRKARNSLHFSRSKPSRLLLPLVKEHQAKKPVEGEAEDNKRKGAGR